MLVHLRRVPGDGNSVIVGNVGTIYEGPEHIARQEFNMWRVASRAKRGRAAGETVTLLFDDATEPKEYIGRLDRGAYR